MEGGYCTYTNNEKMLSVCEAPEDKTQSECEADCTSSKSCVGYEFDAHLDSCVLYPSNCSCPFNYTFYDVDCFAITMSDLMGNEWSRGNLSTISCYGKIEGKNIKSLVYHL